LCGYNHFNEYIILGDDVAIADFRVAEVYVSLIDKLGIDISLPKSVLPTEGHDSWEFASKLCVNGVDVSPLPIGLLLNNSIPDLITFRSELFLKMRLLLVSDCFQRLLGAMAPREINPRVVSTKTLTYGQSFSGLSNLSDLLVVTGIHLGLSIIKNYKKDPSGQYLNNFEGRINPSPSLELDDMSMYLSTTRLSFWQELELKMRKAATDLYKQGAANVYKYAWDHNDLISMWTSKAMGVKLTDEEKVIFST